MSAVRDLLLDGFRWVLGARAVPAVMLLAALIATPLSGCSIDRALRPDAYTVQRGDTLATIAARYQVDWRNLAAWNHIGPPYRLSVGQRVYLKPFPPIDYARIGEQGAPSGGHAVQGAAPTIQSRRPSVSSVNPSSSYAAPQENHAADVGATTPLPETSTPSPTVVTTAPPIKTVTPPTSTAASPETEAPAASPTASSAAEDAQVDTASHAAAVSPAPVKAGGPSEDGWQWPATGSLLRGFDPDDRHQGIEIGGQQGAPVYAASSGTVAYNGTGLKGYGRLIIIKHDAHYLSAYGFVDKSLVKQGQTVAAGAHIANMGLGPGNKPMLHFEIRRDGDPVDPEKLLPSR